MCVCACSAMARRHPFHHSVLPFLITSHSAPRIPTVKAVRRSLRAKWALQSLHTACDASWPSPWQVDIMQQCVNLQLETEQNHHEVHLGRQVPNWFAKQMCQTKIARGRDISLSTILWKASQGGTLRSTSWSNG